MSQAPLLAFRTALSELAERLAAGDWSQAGEAGQALAKAVEACRTAGVALSPDALNDARTLFERCVTLTAQWGERLNKDSQQAGNTTRAMLQYRG